MGDCGDAASKPAPSPAACLRQAGESAAPGNSTAFVWVVWKGGPPALKILESLRLARRYRRRGHPPNAGGILREARGVAYDRAR